MKKLLFAATALTLALALAGTAAAQTADVAGEWELTWETPRGPVTQALTLQQDGSTLSGTLERSGPPPGMRPGGGGGGRPGGGGPPAMEIQNGTIDGNTITFTVVREGRGQTMEMEFIGTLDGDTMSGTLSGMRGGGEMEWTAKRVAT